MIVKKKIFAEFILLVILSTVTLKINEASAIVSYVNILFYIMCILPS